MGGDVEYLGKHPRIALQSSENRLMYHQQVSVLAAKYMDDVSSPPRQVSTARNIHAADRYKNRTRFLKISPRAPNKLKLVYIKLKDCGLSIKLPICGA